MTNSPTYGGQAVLEGVMMRGPAGMAIACRRPDGTIAVHAQPIGGVHARPAGRLPFIRGVIALAETLALGMRAIAFSSNVSMEGTARDNGRTEFPEKAFWGSVVVALSFIAGVFFTAPMLLANLLDFAGVSRPVEMLVEGVARVALIVGYIAFVGRIPGIRRVFQYHGAEHMTIHAHEAGAPLTPEGVRAFPKEHTRCGTSFLVLVMGVAFVTFFAFDLLVDQGFAVRALSRIMLIPAIAAVAYELLRIGGRHSGSLAVRIMFLPNIALQALTTKTPDDDQIDVALTSFAALRTCELQPAVQPATQMLEPAHAGGSVEQPSYA